MNTLIAAILAPVLVEPAIRSILLAGSDGELAAWLLEASAPAGALVHVAGTGFTADTQALRKQFGDRIVLHPSRGADALSLMPVPDLLVIDGDANWYTVFSALQAAARQALRLSAPFPLTLVTDTAWPYARRDRYADPAALPAAFVRPHEKAGVLPGQAGLQAGNGLFADSIHARAENEPGNGVLTAIEAFLLEQDGRMAMTSLPMMYGCTLVYEKALALSDPTRLALNAMAIGDGARAAAEATERGRVELAVEAAGLRLALASAQYRNEALREALHRDRAELARMRAQAAIPQPPQEPPSPQSATGLRRAARRALEVAGLTRAPEGDEVERDATDAAQIEKLRSTPILNAPWYYDHYQDVVAAGTDAAEHYYRNGAAEGRDPGPAFSTRFYMDAYPDVAEAGHNPVLHYLASGAAEGRDPGPGFSSRFYLDENPDVAAAGHNPLEHYLMCGLREQRRPCPEADAG